MDVRALVVLSLVSGCLPSNQRLVTYPMSGQGSGDITVDARNGWRVTLDEARVSVGPIYFCATAAASPDLCPSAQAEVTQAVTLDALRPTPQFLAQVRGLTGTIKSAQYDFGIAWLETEGAARPLSGAVEGHSARFRGVATRDGRTLHFTADVDVVPQRQGTHVVQGARTSADVQNDEVELVVEMDPAAWWRGVDFDEFASSATDDITLTSDSRAVNALIVGMTASAVPTFRWSTMGETP
jgi:hypothetical protein